MRRPYGLSLWRFMLKELVGFLFLLAIELWGVIPGFAQTPKSQAPIHQITLDEAVGLLLENNPNLMSEKLRIQIAQTKEITAGLRPNPIFSNTNDILSPVKEYTAVITQLLERGGKRQLRIQSARLETQIAEADFADRVRLLTFEVKKAFIQLLLAKLNRELAQKNLMAFQEILRLNTLRFQKGDISGSDLKKITLEQLKFQNDLNAATLQLTQTRVALWNLLYTPRLSKDFEVKGDLKFKNVQLTLNDLIDAAFHHRPDWISALKANEKAEADARLAVANGKVDITAEIDYKRTGPDNTGIFGFSIPLPLFNRNQGEIQGSRLEVQRSKITLEALKSQIMSEVENAFESFKSTRETVLLYEAGMSGTEGYLKQAESLREVAQFAYNQGETSLLDLLDAERTYRDTQLNYHQALANYLISLYQINLSVGKEVVQ